MKKGLNGPRPHGPRPYGPQQVIIQPPKGYVPPLRNELVPVGVYDTSTGYWVGLPIEAFVEALIWAEKQWTLDRVDARTGSGYVKVTVAIGSTGTKTGVIEVPAGELWYLCCHEIEIPEADGLTAGDLTVNFRVSSFPKVDSVDKAFYSTSNPNDYLIDAADGAKVDGEGLTAKWEEIEPAGSIYDHKLIPITAKDDGTVLFAHVMRDFRECDELNTELRLVAGDKLTLVATVVDGPTVGAIIYVYLRVYGRVGKILVP